MNSIHCHLNRLTNKLWQEKKVASNSCVLRCLSGAMVLFVILLAVGSGSATAADEKVIAKIGNDTITETDLQEMTKAFPDRFYQSAEGQRKALDYLINIYCLGAEAQAQGLDKDPQVQRYMKLNRLDLLARIYLDKMSKDLPAPTEKEAQEFYEKNRAEFTIPESVQLHHILVKTEKEAKDVLARLKKGEKFADVASQVSICPSKIKGGDLDWLPKGTLVKEVEDAAFSMQKGQISGPVKSKFGYHVLFLEDKKPPQETGFDQCKAQILDRLQFTARQARYEKLSTDLRKKMNVQVMAPAADDPAKPASPAAAPSAGPKKN